MDVTGLRRLHTTIRSIVLLTTAGLAASTAWGAGPVVTVNIPAGDAENTLIDFSRQSRVKPIFKTSVVRGRQTHAVVGTFEASDALAKMLAGTDIKFEYDHNKPYEVTLHSPASTADALAQPAPSPDPASDRALQLAALADHVRASETKPLEEVLVTGTLIHGLDAITAPLVFLKQQELKKTGHASVQDVMHALPFVSLAGPREDFGADSNFNRGASINLRGLGANSTLILVNGRRQPGAGIYGDFVDVSTIPWAAVEKIEVMPDGTSALYGSDAIGGVVNIILRKDLDGGETRTRLASSHGGADETVLAHLHTADWDSGRLLFAYQFSKRSALPVSARAYAAEADKTPFGGSNFGDFRSNPGNILDIATFQPLFAIPPNQDGTALDPGDLLSGVNLQNLNEGADLIPERRAHSAYVNFSQTLTDQLKIFAEGRFNIRNIDQELIAWSQVLPVPSTNAFFVDPFGGSPVVLVAYNFFDDLGARHAVGETRTATSVAGLELEFGRGWQATLSASYGRERMRWTVDDAIDSAALSTALADSRPETAFNPFGAGSNTSRGTLEAIKTTENQWAESTLSEATLIADGPALELPAGAAKLALGLNFREEQLSREANVGSLTQPLAHYGREISAAFVELAIPVLRRLDLSLAARFEEYSDFGSTFNPKFGVRWVFSDQLRLRSSWGTSFRAPALVDLDERRLSSAGLVPLPDPGSENGQSLALVRFGKNAELREESAITWTAGFDFAPEAVPGLSFSFTHFSVNYEDRILQPGPLSPLDILIDEARWNDIITRDPSQASVDAICNSSNFFGSPGSCAATPPSVIVDLRLRNLASTRVKGFDVEFNQILDTRFGQWNFGAQGTYLRKFNQSISPSSSSIDVVDTAGNPLGLRLRGTVDWYQRGEDLPGFAISAGINHNGGYVDGIGEPRRSVASWTSLDLQMRYRTAPGPTLLDDIEFALGAVNTFNRDPSFLNTSIGYDVANSEPIGRVVNVYIQKNW